MFGVMYRSQKSGQKSQKVAGEAWLQCFLHCSATVHWIKQWLVNVAVYLAHAVATLRKFVYRLVHLNQ
jgi:hypothetical protein